MIGGQKSSAFRSSLIVSFGLADESAGGTVVAFLTRGGACRPQRASLSKGASCGNHQDSPRGRGVRKPCGGGTGGGRTAPRRLHAATDRRDRAARRRDGKAARRGPHRAGDRRRGRRRDRRGAGQSAGRGGRPDVA